MTNVFLNIPITRVSRVNFIIEVMLPDEQLDKISDVPVTVRNCIETQEVPQIVYDEIDDVINTAPWTAHEYLIGDIDILKTSADKTTIYPVGSDLKISLSNLLSHVDVSS